MGDCKPQHPYLFLETETRVFPPALRLPDRIRKTTLSLGKLPVLTIFLRRVKIQFPDILKFIKGIRITVAF